ncbi:MAG: hypothetical protein U9Q81_04125 [Pseudomonadota bacterium]|nr:hypothetical protein [Pseudomonadota bacterium]
MFSPPLKMLAAFGRREAYFWTTRGGAELDLMLTTKVIKQTLGLPLDPDQQQVEDGRDMRAEPHSSRGDSTKTNDSSP